MHRALPFALAALFAAVGSAVAQPPEGAAPPSPPLAPAEAFMKQLDADGDGKVSQAEALTPQAARMKEVDANGDGFVSGEEASTSFKAQVPAEMLAEMQKRGMPDPGETFVKNLDKDGDGKVSPTEFQQPTVDAFTRMDANADGAATQEEAAAYFAQMQQKMEEQMRKMQEHQEQTPKQ